MLMPARGYNASVKHGMNKVAVMRKRRVVFPGKPGCASKFQEDLSRLFKSSARNCATSLNRATFSGFISISV